MSTKTKTEDTEDARKMVGWRIRMSLLERIKDLVERLPEPGTKASEASIVESILLGETTLKDLERRAERKDKK